MPANAAHYSRLDQLLHHVALGWAPIAMASFDLERSRYLKSTVPPTGGPVFIAGMARAGTTVFARALDSCGCFASARYRDMPFPLAPNGWAALSRSLRKPVKTAERGHGDGMTHDLSSLEAIEELFWRTHDGAAYIKPTGLQAHHPSPAVLDAFADWMALVRFREEQGRYLCKNNNNILRLAALARRFPDGHFIHPFREPLQQAASLLNQHLRATSLHKSDPFRRNYMRWLGHHEFGADQRPFKVGNCENEPKDAGTLGYWVQQWANVYRALLTQPAPLHKQQVFVDFDKCCRQAGHFERQISQRLSIDLPAVELIAQPTRAVDQVDRKLLDEAREIHAALIER